MSREQRTYLDEAEVKRAIVEIGRRIYASGYVAANDGNISCKVGDNALWVTPTGVSKGFMTEEMLVKTDLEGHILEGDRRPSSEIKMHLRAYQENEAIQAVVHAHPLYATMFACAGLSLDSRFLPEGIVQLGVVPCAPFAMPGSTDVPDSIVPYLHGYNAILLGNHGALSWGETLERAWMRMESVEYLAHITLLSEYILKRHKDLSDAQLDTLIAARTAFGIQTGGRPS